MQCREDRISVGSIQRPLLSARTEKQREAETTFEKPQFWGRYAPNEKLSTENKENKDILAILA